MSKNKKQAGFATRAIHEAYECSGEHGALTPPIHMTSTFAFESVEHGAALFAGEQQGHFYSRISNPTLEILEKRFASLEGAEAALAFASGMGAICGVLWTLLKSGDELIVDKTLYGCTFAFMRTSLKKFGITLIPVDMQTPENILPFITKNTKVIYFETPANPNMRLVDIKAVSAIAKAHNITTVVDNTYATPYITRPLSLGADIVVHSATKYLGGHGDLIGGLAAGNQEMMQHIRLEGLKDMTGAVMAPMTAFLILRGLKTLELRMERHTQSAQHLASILKSHPKIADVFYPGLKTFNQYALATQQMAISGGMMAFELRGGLDAGIKMMNALKLIQRAVSLGDAETLIQHPASMTHSVYTPQERKEHLIADGLVRMSVGLETCKDIEEDLLQALDVI